MSIPSVPARFQLTSPAFEEGGTIPVRYTGDGEDRSPPLAWTSPPEGTRSLTLVCEDPDAGGRTWVHWVLYRISPGLLELAEGLPPTETVEGVGLQGRTDFGRVGYGGPCPPVGPVHRYRFLLQALAVDVPLPPGLTRHQVSDAVARHVLATTRLTGLYRRI